MWENIQHYDLSVIIARSDSEVRLGGGGGGGGEGVVCVGACVRAC